MGSSADLMVEPFGAILLGTAAGVLSVVGYVYIQPFLERTIGYARSRTHTHTHIQPFLGAHDRGTPARGLTSAARTGWRTRAASTTCTRCRASLEASRLRSRPAASVTTCTPHRLTRGHPHTHKHTQGQTHAHRYAGLHALPHTHTLAHTGTPASSNSRSLPGWTSTTEARAEPRWSR